MTKAELENWFTYHETNEVTLPKYVAIRKAAFEFGLVLIENTPTSADQTAAIRKLREVVMTANAAVACGGK